jgi:hypothetical protein
MIWLPFFALFLETLRLDEIRLGWRDDDDGDSDDDGTMVEERMMCGGLVNCPIAVVPTT